jgi:mono/diheme cytochrome c family protein
MTPLPSLELPWKLLITLFLIVLSSGFVVSELYLMHTTEMADGKPGMSLEDITLTFHGDPKATRLKHMVLGPMKKYFSDDESTTLKAAEQADLDAVVAWSDNKAPEIQYWDPVEKDKKPAAIFNIFNDHNCFNCHAPDATMKGNKKDSPLDTYAGVSKFTKPNTGMDTGRLLMLSHVHLLGMGMMFLLAGAAVALTVWPKWIRCALIVGGLSSILFDIFGWWGVKYGGGAWSPVVMVGGILMAASFGGSVFVAMYDMWMRKRQA